MDHTDGWDGTTRRTLVGSILLGLGVPGIASATQQPLELDADNLVAENPRFTITVAGLDGEDVREVTVVVDGVAFATVEILQRDPAVLVVDPRNLARAGRFDGRDSVDVDVWVSTGEGEFAGSDESQVLLTK